MDGGRVNIEIQPFDEIIVYPSQQEFVQFHTTEAYPSAPNNVQ